jgi:hypothetical protein
MREAMKQKWPVKAVLFDYNKKHVSVPLGTANTNSYFQDTGLQECFAGWQA